MKTSRLILSTLLGFASLVLSQAAPNDVATERINVEFFESDKFRDVGRSYLASERDREYDLAQIRDHLVAQASRTLPEGQRLEVTFTDIDMAGEFEPWRGPRYSDVRIVKDIYAPRMALSFRVTTADGNVIKEGKRELRDMAFNHKLLLNRSDVYRHEKELLNDWLRSEFPPQRKR